MPFIGPEPFCGDAKAITRVTTKQEVANKSLELKLTRAETGLKVHSRIFA